MMHDLDMHTDPDPIPVCVVCGSDELVMVRVGHGPYAYEVNCLACGYAGEDFELEYE